VKSRGGEKPRVGIERFPTFRGPSKRNGSQLDGKKSYDENVSWGGDRFCKEKKNQWAKNVKTRVWCWRPQVREGGKWGCTMKIGGLDEARMEDIQTMTEGN